MKLKTFLIPGVLALAIVAGLYFLYHNNQAERVPLFSADLKWLAAGESVAKLMKATPEQIAKAKDTPTGPFFSLILTEGPINPAIKELGITQVYVSFSGATRAWDGKLQYISLDYKAGVLDTTLFPVLTSELGKPAFQYMTFTGDELARIGAQAIANKIREGAGGATEAIRPPGSMQGRHAVWKIGKSTIEAVYEPLGVRTNSITIKYDPKSVQFNSLREEYEKKLKFGQAEAI